MEWITSHILQGERCIIYLLMINWFAEFFPLANARDDLKVLNAMKESDNILVQGEEQEIEDILNRPESEESEEEEEEEPECEEEECSSDQEESSSSHE